MLLDGRGDGDALRDDERDRIDGDGYRSAAVLHAGGIAGGYCRGAKGQRGVHGAGCEGIAIHGFRDSSSRWVLLVAARVRTEVGLPTLLEQRKEVELSPQQTLLRNVSLGQQRWVSLELRQVEVRD